MKNISNVSWDCTSIQSHCCKTPKLILAQPLSHDLNISTPVSGRTQSFLENTSKQTASWKPLAYKKKYMVLKKYQSGIWY